MVKCNNEGAGTKSSAFFYGWYIVGVGILVNIAGTFAFSSTLSIFLKPITEELGVSRGAFSLIRTFEIGVAALIVPLLVSDRRRSPAGLPGHERHDRAMVRAQARTRHGHRQFGNGRC